MSALATLGTDLTALAEKWSAAGVACVIDPRDMVPPCVWLIPDTLTFDRLGGSGVTATVNAIAVTPDTGTSRIVLDDLGALLDGLDGLAGITGVVQTVTLTLPSLSPDPLLGLQTTLTLT
ncbi:small-conductance mechanosensitive channel [Leifsonia xyli subsp. cynodontis DSM 46306]|uniref:Uncharacterized protein n=1 Tax=Leifsonia xyli subsp. cynodontis DSM 46306 TaxID=1389489 RepID=U3P9G0_LEIXC|nr:hypothetical protein [Leifsonia xyli]AGW42456.1 small-conductance mechanosensitive channel [Leifsonia xyli subsp. cynodontis DSM 46306]